MNKIYSRTHFIVRKKKVAKALNIIITNRLTYLSAEFLENDDLKITILSSDESKYLKVFKSNDFDLELISQTGLVSKIKRNKHRIGLLIGFFILLVSVFISSKFVWTINISGNEKLSENEIIDELNNSGFSIGSYIPSINYKDLHNRILLSSKNISWVSINITGNVANVIIKEKFENNSNDDLKYTNIVSKFDGQIVSINIEEGEKQISIGDVVKKGDLLVSGIIDSKSQGVRYVDASGTIKAIVNKKIEIKIPFKNTIKKYTGKVYNNKYYKIFNKIINFSLKSNNYDIICDTIEKTEQISLFNKINLPIYRTVIKNYEYEYSDVTYSNEQAVNIALKKLRESLDNELKSAELVSKKISTNYDNEFFCLICEINCIEDIGTKVEFEVQNNGG